MKTKREKRLDALGRLKAQLLLGTKPSKGTTAGFLPLTVEDRNRIHAEIRSLEQSA